MSDPRRALPKAVAAGLCARAGASRACLSRGVFPGRGTGGITVLEFLTRLFRRHAAPAGTPPARAGSGEGGRRADEHFGRLVAGVRDYAIFMLDPGGHVATWNAGAGRIKGYTAREIIGQH